MTSILLIYPYFNSGRSRSIFRFPPLGLGYLAASLRKAGHKVGILDCTFMDRSSAYQAAAETRADIAGVYCMVTMKEEAMGFARALRSKCRLIVAGGPLPSCDPAAFVGDFDVVVRGEGERTILELVDVFAQGRDYRSVRGIAFRNGAGGTCTHSRDDPVLTPTREHEVDLSALPHPARDMFPNQEYKAYSKRRSGYAITSVITTRGCPFNCEFCSNAVFGRSYRERSATDVIDEVEETIALGYERIHFADDVFTLRKERLVQICEEVKARRLRFQWECLGRVDSIDRDTARLMKEAGCDRVFFGVESSNDTVLKLMGKRISVADVRHAVEAAEAAGLKTGAFFILCYPGDTDDSVLGTLKFATSLPLDYLSFTMPYPLPGTALYERVKNRIKREWKFKQGLVTEHSLTFDADFSQKKMRFAILKGHVEFALRKRLGKGAGPVLKPFEAVSDVAFRLMK